MLPRHLACGITVPPAGIEHPPWRWKSQTARRTRELLCRVLPPYVPTYPVVPLLCLEKLCLKTLEIHVSRFVIIGAVLCNSFCLPFVIQTDS